MQGWKQTCFAGFLDFSSIFDIINHTALLSKLLAVYVNVSIFFSFPAAKRDFPEESDVCL